MEVSNTFFKIKKSNVHITNEGLKMWADENLAGFKESSGMGNLVWGVLFRLAIIAYFSYQLYTNAYGNLRFDNYFMILLFVLFAYNLGIIVYSLRFNYTNYIPRESIRHIEVKKGIPLLILDQIIVHFNKDGKQLKRLFILPSPLFFKNARPDAIQKLKNAGLYAPTSEEDGIIDSL